MLTDLLVKNASSDRLYVEDVFSTWLYTGSGTGQTISNGIDLAGKGGLIWEKRRNGTDNHYLTDTARGGTKYLISNLTNANNAGTTTFYNFLSNGYSTSNSWAWANGATVASWTFREAPKFFDIVTWTGSGVNRAISHSLGATPGMIIVKRTDAAANWAVYHRGLNNGTNPQNFTIYLNLTNDGTGGGRWNSTAPTSTQFTVGTDDSVNASGGSYVAYLFAHDTSTDGIVQCGSYTGNGSTTGPTITLGWEPQFLLVKGATEASANWFMFDTMRGLPVDSSGASLVANSANAEGTSLRFTITPTGFYPVNNQSQSNASGQTYIYLAIRRGPMRTPTDATKVFAPYYRSGSAGTTIQIPSTALSYAPDAYLGFVAYSGSSYPHYFVNKLADQWSLQSETTSAEQFGPSNPLVTFAGFQGKVQIGAAGLVNASSTEIVDMFLRRAPGFFDVVCYTGTGSARTVSHNLEVAPELMIVKSRSDGTRNWSVYEAGLGTAFYLNLNDTSSKNSTSTTYWNSTSPTSTVFSLGAGLAVNASGATYVAYLFASCPGVSKVGSYTGTGTTLQINCGFTNGARFILIKRTDSTGGWYFWNSASGISAGNDPFMQINSNAQITPSTDYIDPYSAGFEITSTAPAAVNANGGTYIYLAIA